MADYIVNRADPTSPTITIQPKQVNGPGNTSADTSLRLFGAGHTNWGEAVNENFVRLLENCAGATPPDNPIVGQLWVEIQSYIHNTVASVFYLYNAVTNTWNTITVSSAASAPVSPSVGDYWYDTVNEELFWFNSANDGVVASWLPRSMGTSTTAPSLSDTPLMNVKVYDAGADDWFKISSVEVSDASTPLTIDQTGALRYSPTSNTLYVWSGTTWDALVTSGGSSFTSNVDMNGFRVVEVGNPINGTDALNLQTGNSLYVDVAGDTMTGNLNLGANQITFSNLFFNEGNGTSTSIGPDIRATQQLAIAAESHMVTLVDYNNTGTGNFVVAKGALVTDTDIPLLTVYNDGEIRANTASYETLVVNNNTLTNKKYVDDKVTTEGTGLHTIWIPTAAIQTQITNGAAQGGFETPTNKILIKTLDYAAGVNNYAQFTVQLPKSWNEGTVTAQVLWSHPATTISYGVVWGIRALALSNGDAIDVAFGAQQLLVDTGGITDTLYKTSVSAPITIGNTPITNDTVIFQVSREVSNGSDTMAVVARLHGVVLYYETDAQTDD